MVLITVVARLTWPTYVLGRGDVLYDATVAHHLVHDHSFSTNLLPLGGLRVLDRLHLAQTDPWPSAHKFPAAQARLALFFLLLGESTRTAEIASLVAYAVLALMLYEAIARTCGSRRFALAAVALFLLQAYLRAIAMSGLTLTGDAAIAFGVAVLWQRSLTGKGGLLALGIAVGVLVLHRYSFVLLLPWVAVSLHRSNVPRRRRFLLGAGAVLLPFWAYSLARYHMLFPSYLSDSLFLHRTPYLRTDPWFTREWPSLGAVLLRDPGAFLAKLGRNVVAFVHECTGSPGGWLQATSLVALAGYGLWLRRDQERGATDRYWLGFGALNLVAVLFLSSTMVYHFYAFPLIWLVASEAAWTIVGRVRATRGWIGAAAASALIPAPFVGEQIASQHVRDEYDRGLRQGRFHLIDELAVRSEVQRAIDRRANAIGRSRLLVLGGTLPWELAFGSRHRYLPIIPSPFDLRSIDRTVGGVDAMYLPVDFGFAGDGEPPPLWWIWQRLAMRPPETFCGLRRLDRFSDGSTLYVRAGDLGCTDTCQLETGLEAEWPAAAFGVPLTHGVESRGPVHWRWLDGRRASIPFVACRTDSSYTLAGYFQEAGTVTIGVNGHTLWTGRARDRDGAPAKVTFDVPANVLRDGVNDLELGAERQNKYGLAMAFCSFGRSRPDR